MWTSKFKIHSYPAVSFKKRVLTDETVFSKCAESLENGRRLENLSWRVWNRETFCCEEPASTAAAAVTTTPTAVTAVPRRPRRQDSDTYSDLPELSSSVESAASDYDLKEPRSDAVNIKSSRSCLLRTDSAERYRGKEKHMTPVHLVKLMEDLDKSKSGADDWMSKRSLVTSADVSTAVEASMPKQSSSTCSPAPSAPQATSVGSAASYSTEVSAHSVVRGFTPGQNISTSVRSSSGLVSESTVSVKASLPTPKKTRAKSMFIIGSSNSSASDDESDSEDSFTSGQHLHKSKLSEGLRRNNTEKRTSFRSEVSTRTFREEESYTEDDEVISESAIEDEDSSDDWESSTDSAQSSYNEQTLFQRVESRPQLASRRSLLSTMLHEPKVALANAGSRSTPALRSRTTSPSGPSLAHSPRQESPLTSKPTTEITRSKPIIMTTSNMHPPALSPRTTRRNMLATELTESLRRHLLWERQQKNTTAAAVLKRRHTAHDVTKLNDFPRVDCASKGNTSKNNSWNHYFDQGLHEYHVAGW